VSVVLGDRALTRFRLSGAVSAFPPSQGDLKGGTGNTFQCGGIEGSVRNERTLLGKNPSGKTGATDSKKKQ